MKQLILSIFCLLAAFSVRANDSIPSRPNIFDDMPNVQLHQDSLVGALMEHKINGQGEIAEINGYRVQIFSSNRQQTAKSEALQLEKEITDKVSMPVYVLYLTPFWKVRLGNFRTFDEANTFKNQFLAQFPQLQGDTYVVRDKIQVLQ